MEELNEKQINEIDGLPLEDEIVFPGALTSEQQSDLRCLIQEVRSKK